MKPPRFLLATALLVAATAGLYTTRLSYAPMYLIHDEVNYSLQAVSIADSGHDLNGRLLPVYFSEPEFIAGRDPLMIYTTALILKVLPLSESAVRLSIAIAGVFDVLLIALVTRALFKSDWMGLCAGLLLALSPAHFIHSRIGVSALLPLPFAVGWLWGLLRYEESGEPTALYLGVAALGLGFYSYLAAFVMFPIYLLLTLIILVRRSDTRALKGSLVVLAAILAPIVLWHIAHPERFSALFGGYRIDAAAGGLVHSAPRLASLDGIRFRVGEWWTYFNPDYLFVSGDTSMTNSTRHAGAFPLACAVLIPVGLYRLWRGRPIERVILAGFLTAPLAVVIAGTLDLNRYRGLLLLPFGVIIAAYGVAALLETRRRVAVIAVALLVASVPLQFSTFYADYLGRYRIESSVWFGGDLRGAIASVINRKADGDAVFISERIPYAAAYWSFYNRVAGHEASTVPTAIDAAFDLRHPVSGSWLIVPAAEDRLASLEGAGWRRTETFTEPTGEPSFALFRKEPVK